MYKLAKSDEKEELFINTAAKMGIDTAVVEKDFWVCLTLDFLFQRSKWKSKLAFKGGTSLSKVYGLIKRFSEDIDLILDWRVLGYEKEEPWKDRTNTQQQKFIIESKNRLYSFLANEFLPAFKLDMETIVGQNTKVYIDQDDVGTVNVEYPSLFTNNSILKEIRLEIGALAAWTPTQNAKIKPYVMEYYPDIFQESGVDLVVTTAERTFWEKATILHQEAFRPVGLLIPSRYSRHYYDLYCMADSKVKDEALNKPKLLEKVVNFNQRFYPRKWARYELARIGTLKLYPAKHSIADIKKDYIKMRNMIYGDYPEFDVILKRIALLESEINSLKSNN